MERNLRSYTRRQLHKGFFSSIEVSLTNWIIIINILAYILMHLIIAIFGIDFLLDYFALQPSGFFNGKIWTLFTSMFMHSTSSIGHLIFNMVSLFFIGNFVEKIIGRKRFLWFYFISGIFAGIFYSSLAYFFGSTNAVLLNLKTISSINSILASLRYGIFGSPDIYAVGASGAIFGLLGLLAVLTPRNRVYLIAGPLIGIIIQSILYSILPSTFFGLIDLILTVYIIISIFAIFSMNEKIRKIALFISMPFGILPIIAIVPLIIVGLFVNLPIGNMAHLGGLIAGIIYATHLKRVYPKKTQYISRIFS